jgi:hypothetical protein
MEKRRMTAREKGVPYFPECFDRCGGNPKPNACADCDFTRRTCEKLAAYEETGLTPEGVEYIKKAYNRLLIDYGKMKDEK